MATPQPYIEPPTIPAGVTVATYREQRKAKRVLKAHRIRKALATFRQ